jgi:hypothetical protein
MEIDTSMQEPLLSPDSVREIVLSAALDDLEDARVKIDGTKIFYKGLHQFRSHQHSQGVNTKAMTDIMWGLVPLYRCHHVSCVTNNNITKKKFTSTTFDNTSISTTPAPSTHITPTNNIHDMPMTTYRVRICKTCCGEPGHIELGTYNDQESAILVNDAFEIIQGRYHRLLVLQPDDQKYFHLLQVQRCDRSKGKEMVSLLDVIAERRRYCSLHSNNNTNNSTQNQHQHHPVNLINSNNHNNSSAHDNHRKRSSPSSSSSSIVSHNAATATVTVTLFEDPTMNGSDSINAGNNLTMVSSYPKNKKQAIGDTIPQALAVISTPLLLLSHTNTDMASLSVSSASSSSSSSEESTVSSTGPSSSSSLAHNKKNKAVVIGPVTRIGEEEDDEEDMVVSTITDANNAGATIAADANNNNNNGGETVYPSPRLPRPRSSSMVDTILMASAELVENNNATTTFNEGKLHMLIEQAAHELEGTIPTTATTTTTNAIQTPIITTTEEEEEGGEEEVSNVYYPRQRSFTFSTTADYMPLRYHHHNRYQVTNAIDTLTWLASLDEDEVDVARSLFELATKPEPNVTSCSSAADNTADSLTPATEQGKEKEMAAEDVSQVHSYYDQQEEGQDNGYDDEYDSQEMDVIDGDPHLHLHSHYHDDYDDQYHRQEYLLHMMDGYDTIDRLSLLTQSAGLLASPIVSTNHKNNNRRFQFDTSPFILPPSKLMTHTNNSTANEMLALDNSKNNNNNNNNQQQHHHHTRHSNNSNAAANNNNNNHNNHVVGAHTMVTRRPRSQSMSAIDIPAHLMSTLTTDNTAANTLTTPSKTAPASHTSNHHVSATTHNSLASFLAHHSKAHTTNTATINDGMLSPSYLLSMYLSLLHISIFLCDDTSYRWFVIDSSSRRSTRRRRY